MTWAFILDSVPFTPAVVAGETSLGGSESSALGLARALAQRGHDVQIYTTKMDPAVDGTVDAFGVSWWDYGSFSQTNQFLEFDVVVALRVFSAFGQRPINARLRILWNQDLLVPGDMAAQVMAVAWAIDKCAYVSAYHRAQWEQLQPELAPIGWVTRNGFDPAHLPAIAPTKEPHRIIHISRPERGLAPLLAMWPALRQAHPQAELRICRYSSMYDTGPGSWSEVCASYDDHIQAVNEAVGGITYLGELTKPQLYQEIAEAAVMWYPGVSTFAETSCIAAIEAQACGTPFVGSYRGALPDTVPHGALIRGLESDPAYQAQSIAAVGEYLKGCATNSFQYRMVVNAGKAHVAAYSHAVIAVEWEAQVERWFRERYEAHKLGVLRQLLHEDDHVAAKGVAEEIIGDHLHGNDPGGYIRASAQRDVELCERVIAGKEHTAEDYGTFAMLNVLDEAKIAGRFQAAIPAFEQATHVLDVACGNGAFAIALAWANPTVHVHGLDYSTANIARAKAAALEAGVADRLTFEQLTIYDFETHQLAPEMRDFLYAHEGQFDGLFCGEFIEHVANYQVVIDGLEQALTPGASVVYTCPHGAYVEIRNPAIPYLRSHVHRYHQDDVRSIWGPKAKTKIAYLAVGVTSRGQDIGSWVIGYEYQPGRPCGQKADRIYRTRPMPRLTVGIITKNAAHDLGRCLASVQPIADEILVGDTGSTDRTVALAEEMGARVLHLDPVEQQPEGFAGARNAVLSEAQGEWFLWIDADEELERGMWLRRYLDTTVFHGFVLRQTHLYLDGAPTHDIPVRLFRNTGTVRFYGCVHEQPQDGDCNADIHPSLDIADIVIAHWGYLTHETRETKRTKRNLPLLQKDQQVFADRLLGKVLCVREAVLQADTARAMRGGQLSNYARDGYLFAMAIHTRHFDDPAHKYHHLSRPWYEAALRALGLGWEQEIALAGRRGGLEHRHARAERVWVRDAAEYERIVAHKARQIAKEMQPPVAITDPDDPRLGLVDQAVEGVAV